MGVKRRRNTGRAEVVVGVLSKFLERRRARKRRKSAKGEGAQGVLVQAIVQDRQVQLSRRVNTRRKVVKKKAVEKRGGTYLQPLTAQTRVLTQAIAVNPVDRVVHRQLSLCL